MPAVVTDSEVLGQIAADDTQAWGIENMRRQIEATQTPDPTKWAALKLAWSTWLGTYSAWSAKATADLSGGFLAGAWFGVPQYGDQAIAYAKDLAAYQALFTAFAQGQTPASVVVSPTTAAQVANDNLSLPPGLTDPFTLSSGTKVVLGIAALAILVRALRR